MADDVKLQIILAAKNLSDSAFKKITHDVKTLDSKIKGLSISFAGLIGSFGAATGIYNIAKGIFEVGKSFENMEMQLEQITGGRGKETLAELNAWALRMPVDTEEATQAFIRMRAYGLDPTTKNMTTLSDVATIMGKDALPRVSMALGQIAARGKISQQEINQLSEVGINATKYLQDAFGMTVEQLQTSGISIKAIISEIWRGMEKDFRGGSEKATKTVTGMTELLNSEFTELARTISESGVSAAIKEIMGDAVVYVQKFREENQELIKVKLPEYIKEVSDTLKTFVKEIKYILTEIGGDNIKYGIIGRILFGSWGPSGIIIAANEIDKAMQDLAKSAGINASQKSIFERGWDAAKDLVLSLRDAANLAYQIFVQSPANFIRTLPEIAQGLRSLWSGKLTEKGSAWPSENRFPLPKFPEKNDYTDWSERYSTGAKSEFSGVIAKWESQRHAYVNALKNISDEEKKSLDKQMQDAKKLFEEKKRLTTDFYSMYDKLTKSSYEIEISEIQKTLDLMVLKGAITQEQMSDYLGKWKLSYFQNENQWEKEEPYWQRPYQESEAVLADQEKWEKWKKSREDDFKALSSLSERTAEAIEQSFSDITFDALSGKLDSAADYFKAFQQTITRIISDILGQMMKIGLVGNGQGGMGGLFGWLFGKSGGSGSSGGSGLYYGESSAVMSPALKSSTTAPALKQSAVNVTVNNNGSERATVRESRGPSGTREILISIGRDITSGGPMAKAMEMRYPHLRPAGRRA